ncbi:MAG: hypothetical protein JWQ35_6 [Bacteriovoracaceae bacterium]|nr:hypothetical protein [Bacteriovoracaceae bacterium]
MGGALFSNNRFYLSSISLLFFIPITLSAEARTGGKAEKNDCVSKVSDIASTSSVKLASYDPRAIVKKNGEAYRYSQFTHANASAWPGPHIFDGHIFENLQIPVLAVEERSPDVLRKLLKSIEPSQIPLETIQIKEIGFQGNKKRDIFYAKIIINNGRFYRRILLTLTEFQSLYNKKNQDFYFLVSKNLNNQTLTIVE